MTCGAPVCAGRRARHLCRNHNFDSHTHLWQYSPSRRQHPAQCWAALLRPPCPCWALAAQLGLRRQSIAVRTMGNCLQERELPPLVGKRPRLDTNKLQGTHRNSAVRLEDGRVRSHPTYQRLLVGKEVDVCAIPPGRRHLPVPMRARLPWFE